MARLFDCKQREDQKAAIIFSINIAGSGIHATISTSLFSTHGKAFLYKYLYLL